MINEAPLARFAPLAGGLVKPLYDYSFGNIANTIEQQFLEANNWPFGSALSFILMYATFIALMIRAFLAKRSTGVDA